MIRPPPRSTPCPCTPPFRSMAQSPHLARRLDGAEPLLDRPLAIARVPYGFRHRASPGETLFRLGDQARSEEHTSELQSRQYLVCRLLLEKKTRHVRPSLLPL